MRLEFWVKLDLVMAASGLEKADFGKKKIFL